MNQGSGGDISQSMKRANNKVRLGSVRVVATLLSSVLLFGAAIFGVAFKLVNDLATSVSSNPSATKATSRGIPKEHPNNQDPATLVAKSLLICGLLNLESKPCGNSL